MENQSDVSLTDQPAISVEFEEPSLPQDEKIYFSDLIGQINTVTSAPSNNVYKVWQQIIIYATGGVWRWYFFDALNNVWKYSPAGPVSVVDGGTGQTSYTNGQLLIGNTTGNTLTKNTLTAGANITVTNGPGTITIAAIVPNTPVYKILTTTHDRTSTTVQNIAHGLGRTPVYCRITGRVDNAGAASTSRFGSSDGGYDGNNNASVSLNVWNDTNQQASNDSTYGVWLAGESNANIYTRAIITWDSTNIILTWSKVGTTSGTDYLLIEIFA